MDKIIYLNFLSILPENFNFTVYKKPYQEKDQEQGDIFRYKLPQNSNNNYVDFWVSFLEREGYSPIICTKNTNNILTTKFLWYLLNRNLSTEKHGLDYTVYETSFQKSIDFTLDHSQFGKKIITFQPYFLKELNKFGFLLDFCFKVAEGVPFNREIQRLSLSLDKTYKSNIKYYSDKYNLLEYFIQNYLPNIIPLKHDDLSLGINNQLEIMPSDSLNTKTYICENRKKANSQYMGVKNHGPFKRVEDSIEYIFIFEKRFRNFANDIYLGLVGKKFGGLFPGISEVFKLNLEIENVTRITLENYDKNSLDEAFNHVLQIIESKPNKKIMSILILPQEDISFNNTRAYYYLKYLFFKHNLPLQVLNFSKLNNYNSLKWSIANIALQIFSKLGGIPWIVEPSNNKCLILGIGSAHKKDTDGIIRKYFAYSVCLDSSGIFKRINILAQKTTKTEYLKTLETELINTIKNEIQYGYDKCVLHIPFKIRKDEINSIKRSIAALRTETSIEFRVLKINTENKFFGFSSHNTKIPYESTYLKLSNNEYLIWFEGLNYGKENVYKKIGNPVHLEFLRDEGEDRGQDISYLQDVINLSGANWRGFNSKLTPISIYYSSLIAQYTKEFELINNLEDIDNEICSITSPWFL